MASLAQMRDSIKSTLKANIAGLNVYDTAPDVQEVPGVVVTPISADFHVSMGRGSDTWEFDLAVLVARTDTRMAQEQLDQYISGSGAKSVRQVLFQNSDLGLADTDSTVKSMRGYGGTFDSAGSNYVGAVLRLHVITSGTE